MLVFAFARLVFFAFYTTELRLQGVTFGEVILTLLHAWRLDLSTFCYLSLLPFLLCAAQLPFRKSWAPYAIFGYIVLMLLIYFTVVSGEIGIYSEWTSKLSYKALFYLRNPSEMANSTSTSRFIGLILLVASSTALWAIIYRRWVFDRMPVRMGWLSAILCIPLTPGLLFLGIRGGYQPIPIQQYDAYFSQKLILNDAAVNPVWNLGAGILYGSGIFEKNPFILLPHDEALAIVERLHHVEKDSTTRIINAHRPNIVIIILESWTGDIIESISGTPGVTPCFARMEQEGLMFGQVYSGGKRSQQGLTGILAGYPALPVITVCDFPEKVRRLPTLTQQFNRQGYHSSFYFGGDLMYGNIGAFIVSNGFARVMEEKSFSGKGLHRGKLGIHDEDVLARQLEDLSREQQPFFSVLFTLSSHSPFDQPLQNALQMELPQMPFLNSVYYTDKCLGEYFDKAKQQSWYDSTLFILVADHGRVSHIPRDYYSFEHVRVPLLLYGNVLKPEFRGRRIERLATQADISKTLLKQLGMDASPFFWSKDLLNPYTGNFVCVEENVGMGYKRPEGSFVYNVEARTFISKDLAPNDSARIFNEGAAYLQVLFQQFIDL